MIVLLGIGGPVSLLLRRNGPSVAVSGSVLSLISSLLGIVVSSIVIIEGPLDLGWEISTFFGEWSLSLDPLGAFFLLVICIVMACVSVYSIGYIREYEGVYDIGVLSGLSILFFLSLVLVVSSTNVILFLISWETMSMVSYLLVVFENRKNNVVSAGYLYLTMTHLGTAAMTVALLLMAHYAGSYSFEEMAGGLDGMPLATMSAVFVLLLIGLGTKAGMVPLHVWLPAAHPAAPSNISALMSGVMVKMALFMMVRSFFDLLVPTEHWWGLLVVLLGCISALLGVLYSLKERDIKSTLAYSTVENMGIMLIGLGTAMVFASYGLSELSAFALLATLFHALNHAIFKALLFMGAGSVARATHTRNMESMGGLAKRMPYTSALTFLGLLSMAAMPPFGGFVSEWLLFQSLIQSVSVPDVPIKMLMSVSIAVLAITGALAVSMAVRLFSSTFLARPRTEAAERAHESPRSMVLGMAFLATLCIAFGVLSLWAVNFIDNVTSSVLGVSIGSDIAEGLTLRSTDEGFASMAPSLIAVLLVTSAAIAWTAAYTITKGWKERISGTWDCGTPLGPRNEYTATGTADPIVRVFNTVYKPRSELRTEPSASPLIKKRLFYEIQFIDIFEKYLYRPVAKSFIAIAKRLSIIQAGSIQAYLSYIFVMLVALLLLFR